EILSEEAALGGAVKQPEILPGLETRRDFHSCRYDCDQSVEKCQSRVLVEVLARRHDAIAHAPRLCELAEDVVPPIDRREGWAEQEPVESEACGEENRLVFIVEQGSHQTHELLSVGMANGERLIVEY